MFFVSKNIYVRASKISINYKLRPQKEQIQLLETRIKELESRNASLADSESKVYGELSQVKLDLGKEVKKAEAERRKAESELGNWKTKVEEMESDPAAAHAAMSLEILGFDERKS